ncbi:unnamed protein product, partial [Closterium sp. NIES-65]
EMDGFDSSTAVIVLAATNRADVIDPALRRPGRFDRIVAVEPPDRKGREAILTVHVEHKELPLSTDVDIQEIAVATSGFTGADLANLVNEAALLAARRDHEEVTKQDFDSAVERALAGIEKKRSALGRAEKAVVARHEAGHALLGAAIAKVLPDQRVVQKISIVPRSGGALGFAYMPPPADGEERLLVFVDELRGQLAVLLGGRAAEDVCFGGRISTGAVDDIRRATDVAYKAVAEYGLSGTIGPMSVGTLAGGGLDGGGGFSWGGKDQGRLSDQVQDEVQQLLQAALEVARAVLVCNKGLLEDLGRTLQDNETVEGAALSAWLAQVEMTAMKGSPIDALIQNCLLQERSGEKTFQYNAKDQSAYTLKWSFHNELGLVFVAVYQRMLQLLYVDDLLTAVRDEFADGHYDPKKTSYPDFDDVFKQLLRESEQHANELKRPKQVTNFGETKKGKGMNKATGAGKGKGTGANQRKGGVAKDGGDSGSDDTGDEDGAANSEAEQPASRPSSSSAVSSAGAFDVSKLRNRANRSKQASAKKTGNGLFDFPLNPAKGGGKSDGKTDGSASESESKKPKKQMRKWDNDGPALERQDFSEASDHDTDVEVVDVAKVGKSMMDREAELEEEEDAEWGGEDEDEESEEEGERDRKGSRRHVGRGDDGSEGKKTGWLASVFQSVVGKASLELADIEPSLKVLKDRLMTKNVAEEIAEKLCRSVASSLVGSKHASFTRISSTVQAAMEDALTRILTPKRSIDILRDVQAAKEANRPYVVVFVGVNGVGKSTNLAKVAYWLSQHDIKVMVAACDTFRAGAVEQLRTHARRLQIPLFERGYEKDPAAVAKEAIREATRTKMDAVLVDTAGRMQDNEPLMRALSKLININEPDLVLFVGEALVGNDAVDQLTKFNQRLADLSSAPTPHAIDGILLTKFDTIDDKLVSLDVMASNTDKGVNVQVLLRCRPLSSDDVRLRAQQVVKCNESRKEVMVAHNVAGKSSEKAFTFDRVFGPTSKQQHLYKLAIAPIVEEVLEGFNCTIFAYGQTGTGKTFTMQGDVTRAGENGQLPEGAGVIPRSIRHIFDTLDSQGAEYNIKVTYLELYNEEITDLLAPNDILVASESKKPLALMEDGKGGVIVRGLEEEVVNNSSDIFTLLERGSAKRRTAETMLNKQSSRSHSIFTITIHIKESTPEGVELIKCGKLNLVDLAGSECIGRSGAKEGRAREAGEINKSLLTLGRVITALVDHTGHIPYRDSKLTRLLRDSLGGRTKTCIIATVSPVAPCLEETLNTLEYAQRAKNIKNKPEVNQRTTKSKLLKDMAGEVERLKQELKAQREKEGVHLTVQQHENLLKQVQSLKDLTGQNSDELEQKAEEIKQLSEQLEVFSGRVDDLTKERDGLQGQVVSLSQSLEKTEADLREAVSTIESMTQAETQLVITCNGLRQMLINVNHDNTQLFEKIERMQETSVHNQAAATSLKQQMDSQVDSVRAFVVKQMEILAFQEQQASQGLEDVLSQSTKDLDQVTEEVSQLQQKVFGATRFMKERVQQFVDKNNSSLQSLVDGLGPQQDEMEKLLEEASASSKASVQQIQSLLTGLSAGWDNVQGWWNQYLEKRRAESSSALSSMEALIERLYEETTAWAEMIAHHTESHEEDMSSLEKAVMDIEMQKAKRIMEAVTEIVQQGMNDTKDEVKGRIARMGASVKNLRSANDDKRRAVKGVFSNISSGIADLREKEAMADTEASNEVARKKSEAGEKVASCAGCVERMDVDSSEQLSLLASRSKSYCDHMKKSIGEHNLESTSLGISTTTDQEQVEATCNAGADKLVTKISGSYGAQQEKLTSIASSLVKSSHSVPLALDHHKQQVEDVKGSMKRHLEEDLKPDAHTSRTPQKRRFEIPTEEDILKMCHRPNQANGPVLVPLPLKAAPSPKRGVPSPGKLKAAMQKSGNPRGPRGPLFTISQN